MNQVVMLPIPLSAEAAKILRDDPGKLSLAGEMLTRMLHLSPGDDDPLFALLKGLKREPGVAEMTAEEIEAEIAAVRGQRAP